MARMPQNITVTLELDTSRFEAAMIEFGANVQRLAEAMRRGALAHRRLERAAYRSRLTPGDRHMDRIIRDCLDKRQSAEEMRVRLMVAADVAERWIG